MTIHKEAEKFRQNVDGIVTNPYASHQRSALENASPQAVEGWALVEIARRLEDARKTPDDKETILTHTRLNWRIWTIFQSELVDPECTVPKEIRENLLNLSNFIDKRSAEIIANPDAGKLEVLININRQIGAGLMGNLSDDESVAPPAQSPAASAIETVQQDPAPQAGNAPLSKDYEV